MSSKSPNSKWHSLGDFLAAKAAKKQAEEEEAKTRQNPQPEVPPTQHTPVEPSPSPLESDTFKEEHLPQQKSHPNPKRYSAEERLSVEESLSSGISPSKSTQEGLPEEALIPEEALSNRKTQTLADYAEGVSYGKGYSRINHDFFDVVLTKLNQHAQLLYFHLNRYREGQTDLTVTLNWPKLEQRTHMGKTTLWRAAKILEAHGLVRREEHKFGRNREQGFRFRFFLPESLSTGERLSSAKSLSPQKDYKRKDLKEISKKEFSNCPDCKGSGFYYPHGFDKGVVKCRHERLKEEIG